MGCVHRSAHGLRSDGQRAEERAQDFIHAARLFEARRTPATPRSPWSLGGIAVGHAWHVQADGGPEGSRG